MSTPFKFVKPQVAFVNAPFSHGQPKRGTETGPVQLIKHGLAQQVETLGLSVDAIEDHSGFSVLENDTDIGKLKYPRTVSAATEKVYQEVKKHAQAGKLPVTLGGDHSLAMGTISGSLSAHPELCVVWVDAHADLNTPETTETGNLHGCPVSDRCGMRATSQLIHLLISYLSCSALPEIYPNSAGSSRSCTLRVSCI